MTKKFELLTTIDLQKKEGFKAALSMIETYFWKIIMDKICVIINKMG